MTDYEAQLNRLADVFFQAFTEEAFKKLRAVGIANCSGCCNGHGQHDLCLPNQRGRILNRHFFELIAAVCRFDVVLAYHRLTQFDTYDLNGLELFAEICPFNKMQYDDQWHLYLLENLRTAIKADGVQVVALGVNHKWNSIVPR